MLYEVDLEDSAFKREALVKIAGKDAGLWRAKLREASGCEVLMGLPLQQLSPEA